MNWFGKRRQQDAEKEQQPYDAEKAIAMISARLIFLEALTSRLVSELPPKKRDHLLEQVQAAIRGLTVFPSPEWVPPSGEQEFHAEMHRDLRLFIEKTNNLKTSGAMTGR